MGFGAQAWSAPLRPVPSRTPLYYPDVVTRWCRAPTPAALVAGIDTTAPGADEKYDIAQPPVFH